MVYTGMRRKTFEEIYSAIVDKARTLRYWKGPKRTVNRVRVLNKKPGPKRGLSSKNEFLMIMIKIKTGLSMEILGDLFGISKTQVSRTCLTWWRFLGKVIGSLVYNPEKDVVLATRPKAFAEAPYSDVRHIIDATEVFIETPKSLELAA